MQYISTKLYTNLVNSQSFHIIQVKLMTIDLLQGHVIQYGRQTLFQGAKISMYHISKTPWDILLIYLLLFCYSHILNYRNKDKENYINTFKAHSRESETFVDFRAKISFFIGPRKQVLKSSVCYLVLEKYFQNKNCEAFLSVHEWAHDLYPKCQTWPKRYTKTSQTWPNKILHQKKSWW